MDPVLMQQGGQVLQNVGTSALKQGGGFLANLFKSPFNLLGAIAKQGWGGIVTWGIPAALTAGGIMLFAQDLIRPIFELIGKPEWADKLAHSVGKGGPLQAGLIAAGTGVAVGGGIGALSALWQSITGGPSVPDAPQSTGATIGKVIGTTLTFGAIAAVAIGAMSSKGISHDAKAGDEVVPPRVPGKGASTPVSAKH